MSKVSERQKKQWIRPWNIEKFNDLSNRDERFFSLVIKGALSWLTRNIVLYNKPIRHYIYNTGSSYMYIETNGYKFSWSETSGEDQIYMSRPRCIVDFDNIEIDTRELSQPHIRGTYERHTSNKNIVGFNAEFRRIPLSINLNLSYVLSNFNESIVLAQEFIDKLLFQKYFYIVYLGNKIPCSLEFPQNFKIDMNKLDMSSSDPNNKIINIQLNLCTEYPAFDEQTEIENSKVIGAFDMEINMYNDEVKNTTDTEVKRVE